MKFLLPTQKAQAWQEIKTRLDAGQKVLLEIKEAKRSLDQNAKYHAMLTELAPVYGDTKKGLSEDLKIELGYYHDRVVGGERYRILKSSADFSKKEMIAAIELLYRWAAELGYVFRVE